MTLFTKIITGEMPCHKVAEDNNFIAFLDIQPLVFGHVLIVPKLPIDYIFDHEISILQQLLVFAQPIAKAIKKCVPCKRIGIATIGLEVPHTHLHLVPINSADDLNFTRTKLTIDHKILAELAAQIIKNL